jgi:hypothetical protein
MNSPIVGLRVAGTIFGIVAAGHAARLATGFHIVVGSWEVPFWLNGAGLVVAGGPCVWLWRLSFGQSSTKRGD